MKNYKTGTNVTHTIKLRTLARAYELWCSTDMSQREVARTLNVPHRTLVQAIRSAETRGLYGSYKPTSSRRIIVEFMARCPDALTINEISLKLNLGLDVTKQAVYRCYKEGLFTRKQVRKGSRVQKYRHI